MWVRERSPVRLLLAGGLLALGVATLAYGAFALAVSTAPPPVGPGDPWWYGLSLVTAIAAPVGVGLLLAAAGTWLLQTGSADAVTRE